MGRELKYLIIHCTDTPEGRHITSDDIKLWHTGSKEDGHRGWSRVGYSDMIHLDGTIENLIPYNDDDIVDSWEISNGAFDFNSVSRHVVYVGGGKGKDTRTIQQELALERYVRDFIIKHPNVKVGGHNQFSDKYCPSFSVPDWMDTTGANSMEFFPEKNILRLKVT
jgi:hypothetical protein